MPRSISTSMNRVSAKDLVYTEIKRQIIIGELEPDQVIIEDDLSKQLGISRTPLREGLQRLENEELIIRQPNGRMKVASISIEQVEEIFNVRSMLEGMVVEKATEKATEKDIEYLHQLIRMISDAASEGRVEDTLHYGSKFHFYLYEMSGLQYVVKILNQLNDHINRYRRFVPTGNMERSKYSREEHQKILELIEEKDAKGAAIAMQKHIHSSLVVAIEAVKKYESRKKE